MCHSVIVVDESHEGAVHMQISTIGIDIAKNVFQVHGVDAAGKPVLKKQLRRGQMLEFFGKLPPCLIGMEACATSHHWARELRKLGHDVRLMPPSYVKAYVKRGKNDAADAEAICEAVTRPSMRFVPIKSAEQQGALMLHRTRDLLIRQRTQLINAMRAHRSWCRSLVVGRRAVSGTRRAGPENYPWVRRLLGGRPAEVVAVALANKLPRRAWATLAKGEAYRAPARCSSAAIAVSA